MSAPQKVDYGLYTIQAGQGAMEIAQAVYGDPKRLPWVLEANPDAEFAPGEQIIIPNKKGTVLTALEDDGVASMFLRDLPGRALSQYLDLIVKWNGGDTMDVKAGDLVFVPDRQTNGY